MKHHYVSQLLERRIRKGDYALTGMPAERDLAGEVGVSRVTIRRALEDLQCKGFIERLPNRRVVLSAKARTAIGNLQLAVVAPSNDSFSLDIQQWAAAAESVSRAAGARLRVVNYHHWDDAAISDALRSYDGVFFVTNSEPIPAWAATLLESSDRVVSLSDDLTHLGVPSIVLFPPAFIHYLLDEVQALGHRRHRLLQRARPQCRHHRPDRRVANLEPPTWSQRLADRRALSSGRQCIRSRFGRSPQAARRFLVRDERDFLRHAAGSDGGGPGDH